MSTNEQNDSEQASPQPSVDRSCCYYNSIVEPPTPRTSNCSKAAVEEDTNMSARFAVETSSSDDESTTITCPLFMEGLPSDFSTSPSLAALASLLDEDDNDEDCKNIAEGESKVMPKTAPGGGKVRSTKSRKSRIGRLPYQRLGSKKKHENEATIGEAQLFLKMWKL
jgi:hypothetical protein